MVGLWFGIGTGLLLILMGWATYVFAPRIGPNPLFGVRTWYSLMSKKVWDKSNRAGGLMIMVIGVLVAAAGVLLRLGTKTSPEGSILIISGFMVLVLLGGIVWLVLYTRKLAQGVPIVAARRIRISARWLLPATVLATITVVFLLMTSLSFPLIESPHTLI